MVESRQNPTGILHVRQNAILLRRSRPDGAVPSHPHRRAPGDPRVEIEEVHPVLHQDAAALLRIPEPVLRGQILVGREVGEIDAVQRAQHSFGNNLAQPLRQRRVAHHIAHHAAHARRAHRLEDRLAILHARRQRLLAVEVLSRVRHIDRVASMVCRRAGHRDHVNLRIG